MGLGRDIGERAILAKRCPDAIGILGFVRKQDCSAINMGQQIVGSGAVMALSGSQAQSDREALSIYDRVDFGREPTSGTAETMISIPLFAVRPAGGRERKYCRSSGCRHRG